MSEINEKQMEITALSVLQRGLEKYAAQEGTTFEVAFAAFSSSNTYKELFDYSSLLWTQGPDYLISIYKAELRTHKNIADR